MPIAVKLKAFLKLTRIEHSIMLVIAVFAGELIVLGRLPGLYYSLLSAIVPIFISMGSFAINDYFDVKLDKANGRFDRPIVAGLIKRRHALWVAFFCFFVGVAASAFINAYAFAIALAFAALAALYSFKLKEMLLVGNAYIGLAMAIPFLFGNFVVSMRINLLIVIISATVLLGGIAREIHGTIRDYKGDRKIRNVESLPYYVGARASGIYAFGLYVAAITLSFYLFLANAAGPFHMNLFYIAAIAVVDAMLLYVCAAYLSRKAPKGKALKLARNLSLLAMGLALVIYLVSNFVYFAV